MNVLPIVLLHEMQLLLFVHKCLYHRELLPSVFHNYFTSVRSVHSHNTRRKSDLLMVRAKSSLGQRSSMYKCSKLWNLLPVHLKTNSSVDVYKRKIKVFIFENIW